MQKNLKDFLKEGLIINDKKSFSKKLHKYEPQDKDWSRGLYYQCTCL